MVAGVLDAVRHGTSLQRNESSISNPCGDRLAVRQPKRDPEGSRLDKGDDMAEYPPGWDPNIHPDMDAATAATDLVEKRWRLMEASAKLDKIAEYTQMILARRAEVLEYSRAHHPASHKS